MAAEFKKEAGEKINYSHKPAKELILFASLLKINVLEVALLIKERIAASFEHRIYVSIIK